MPDMFIDRIMNKPLRIGSRTYHVAWDSKENRALIVFVEDPEDLMTEYVPQLEDLVDSDGKEMTFSTELDAHRYLTGLYMESEGVSWKTTT